MKYKFAALALPLPPPQGGGIKTESFPFEGQYFLPSLFFPPLNTKWKALFTGFLCKLVLTLPRYLMLHSIYRIM